MPCLAAMSFAWTRRLGAAIAVALAGPHLAAAQPSANLNDYVLFAERAIQTKGPSISDGDVGVNLPGGELLAPRFFAAANSTVASDAVHFDRNPANTTLQQLFANVVVFGPPATPFTPPIIPDVAAACGFPSPFPACDPQHPVEVPIGTTTVLPPGPYGRVVVHGTSLSASTLVLTGGTYVFCQLKVSRQSELRALAPVTLDVATKVSFGPSTFLGPDPSVPSLRSSDVRVYVDGSLVKLTRDSTSVAHVCAPNAHLRLSKGGVHTGVYVASLIRTEEIFLALGSPSGAFVDASRP
jgi:hypothetical protein